MVTLNVAQLLKSPPGAVREVDFRERLPDPAHDLHLRAPVAGHVKMLRTSRGILVESEHRTTARFECSRCLRDMSADVEASISEEFRPTLDIRSGLPAEPADDVEIEPELLINDHHEIELDELLRQSILTSLPLRPLCEAACPGLCPTCGERLDSRHKPHPDAIETPQEPTETYRPFAGLAELLHGNDKDDEALER